MSLRSIAAQYLPFIKSTEPRVSREESLGLRPVRNSSVTWVLRAAKDIGDHDGDADDPARFDGRIDTLDQLPVGSALTLVVPRREDLYARIITQVFGVIGQKRIELDEFGSQIWLLCDGENAVDKMVAHTCTRYKLNRRQAEVSVVTFMRMLGQRRLIGFRNTERRALENVSKSRGKPTKSGSGTRRRRY